MSEPDNFVLALLREMRADINRRFDEMEGRMESRFAAIERRLDTMDRRLDLMHRNGEKALSGSIRHRAMVERTMASFEDEITGLKQPMERLEAARG